MVVCGIYFYVHACSLESSLSLLLHAPRPSMIFPNFHAAVVVVLKSCASCKAHRGIIQKLGAAASIRPAGWTDTTVSFGLQRLACIVVKAS